MRWAGRLPAHERQKQILRPAYPTHNEVVHGAPAVRVLSDCLFCQGEVMEKAARSASENACAFSAFPQPRLRLRTKLVCCEGENWRG